MLIRDKLNGFGDFGATNAAGAWCDVNTFDSNDDWDGFCDCMYSDNPVLLGRCKMRATENVDTWALNMAPWTNSAPGCGLAVRGLPGASLPCKAVAELVKKALKAAGKWIEEGGPEKLLQGPPAQPEVHPVTQPEVHPAVPAAAPPRRVPIGTVVRLPTGGKAVVVRPPTVGGGSVMARRNAQEAFVPTMARDIPAMYNPPVVDDLPVAETGMGGGAMIAVVAGLGAVAWFLTQPKRGSSGSTALAGYSSRRRRSRR
jgi:hypothetical protein